MESLSQLALALPFKNGVRRSDFYVSACNAEAITWIDEWPNWPFHCMMVYGDSGCGKTHLGHIFSDFLIEAADLTNVDFASLPEKIVVENVAAGVNETELFHLYNFALETKRFLMLTAQQIPVFQLPDLQSRMQATLKVRINAPDDELLYLLLLKGFLERHLLVELEVLEYIVKNSERSFAAIQRFLQKANRLSLEQQRKMTIPLSKIVLEQLAAEKKLERL